MRYIYHTRTDRYICMCSIGRPIRDRSITHVQIDLSVCVVQVDLYEIDLSCTYS